MQAAFPTKASTPAIAQAIQRVEDLGPAYASAVQRIIATGRPASWGLLVAPVDQARERTVTLASACSAGKAEEAEVLEAAAALNDRS